MDWFNTFIVQNFLLLCIGSIVLVNSIQHYKEQRRVSFFLILIVGLAFTLALANLFEDVSKYYGSLAGTFIFAVIGYALRPVIVYLFILMSIGKPKSKLFLLTAIPLFINLVIYCLTFIPAMRPHIVSFYLGDEGRVYFGGGGFLRFASHIIGGLYLVWLTYISIAALRKKHFNHGIAILLCVLFVALAVVIETFFNGNAEIRILNSTIALAAITYYLYAYIERTQMDPLTGVYNRAAYYRDLPRMEKSLVGVVQFDLNGLKYLNDNLGHEEGDRALLSVARAIVGAAKGDMYAYRLGGDEFIVLANGVNEEGLSAYIADVKKELSSTSYRCSIGYAFRKERSTTVHDLIKTAESRMYQDKEEFYRSSGIERRRGERPE